VLNRSFVVKWKQSCVGYAPTAEVEARADVKATDVEEQFAQAWCEAALAPPLHEVDVSRKGAGDVVMVG